VTDKDIALKSFDEMDFHPESEQLVKILCEKTQNTNPLFFRVMVAYYLSSVAAMMRANVLTLDQGKIPVNMYCINLAVSGSGKGYSCNVIESEIIDQFRHNFTQMTFPLLAAKNLPKIATTRAARKGTDPDNELASAEKEFEDIGEFLYSFDSATSPALKQARQKLLMAEAGALNLQIDEIGSNLSGNQESLTTYLELFDVGVVKPKLVKNTADNKRSEEIHGRTPTNMMLFGTPSKLLDGGKIEEEFHTLLETGFGRRCFFGYSKSHERKRGLTAREILDIRTDKSTSQFIEKLSDHLGTLADMAFVGKTMPLSEDVTLLFIQYQIECEQQAYKLGEHEDTRKAEISHRHFKALKLAGTYAFIDGSPEVTERHAYQAIKLAEESGIAFGKLLTRDRPYVKLANYIAAVSRPVTQVDLVEDLQFYKGTSSQKADLLQLAIAHGYQNNIIIKKVFHDGIEFLHGETLKKVDLSKMQVSYSTDFAKDYQSDSAAFEDLHVLTQTPGYHWCTHAFLSEHRSEDNAIPGFNLLVLDVDHGVTLETARELLKEYKSLIYTTKRHTDAEHRFRIILPMNYSLELDAKDYKDFMNNVWQWLPFEVDTATGQRSRKWMSNDGDYFYNDGDVLDILPFIPKTSKNEDFKKTVLDQQGMDNLERWVINNTGDGNRNQMLHRYAMILKDAGYDFEGVRQKVYALNDKLPSKLTEAELMGTVMVSVTKALAA
jgi:hypothetical protein